MVRSAVVLGCLMLLLASSAAAAPQRDMLIQPGVGIGKVKLGMSLKQVRAAWGKPQAVTVRREGKARLTELQYDFAAYFVTLIGSPRRERVVRVGTTLRKEKMANGLGVGSPERRLERALRARLHCDKLDIGPWPGSPYPLLLTNRRECALGERGSPQTVFVSKMRVRSVLPEDWSKSAYVFEVVIRAPGA
jgi:hypothetical protein